MPKAAVKPPPKPAEQADVNLFSQPDEKTSPPPPSATKVPKKAAPRPSTLSNATTLDERAEHFNFLYFGREGSTKTTSVMSAANLGRVLAVNAEGGIRKKPLRDFGIDLANITPWPDPATGVEISYQSLEDLFWELKAELLQDPDSWFASVWDSGTDVVSRLLADVRQYEHERNQRLPEKKRKEHRENPFFTDRDDYGVMTEQVRTLLRRFRDLPAHFLVTALERRVVDEDTGKVVYNPAVNPGLWNDLLGYSDMVIYTRFGQLQVGPDPEVDVVDEVKGLCRPQDKFRAKDRLHAVPRVLAVPTFERVLAYLNEELTEQDDPIQQQWRQHREIDRQYNPPQETGKIKKDPDQTQPDESGETE